MTRLMWFSVVDSGLEEVSEEKVWKICVDTVAKAT